jgi:hypothetical protein
LRLSPLVQDLGESPFDQTDELLALISPGMPPRSFKSEREKTAAALGFCSDPASFSGAVKKEYLDYVREREAHLVIEAAERNLIDSLSYFADEGRIPPDLFRLVLEKAQTLKFMEIVALLLEYRHKRLTGTNDFARFSLDD